MIDERFVIFMSFIYVEKVVIMMIMSFVFILLLEMFV